MHAIPRNWRTVLVVTSAFHAGRTRAAFEWVWSLYTPGVHGAGLPAGLRAPVVGSTAEGTGGDTAEKRRRGKEIREGKGEGEGEGSVGDGHESEVSSDTARERDMNSTLESEWGPEPAPTSYIAMHFAVTADDGLTPEVVAARAGREAKSVAALRANQARITTLADFAEWLYTTHLCYAAGRQGEIGDFAEMKADPALKSY